MAKNIILVRHAKSDWSVFGQKDFDRTLNQRGLFDAPRMGMELLKREVNPQLIIASPASRTKATSVFLAEQLKYNTDNIEFHEELYEASSRNVLSIINGISNSVETAMLVGHNPTFTHIAEYFTKKDIGNIPTCGVVSIHFDVDDWAVISGQTGEMKFFIYPKMFWSVEDDT
ncbi:MAG: histidine phosphatase family protein [Cytophagales bacterium]|nr:MAG: histidine phosphatase family protein [Cytophagales bacterium]